MDEGPLLLGLKAAAAKRFIRFDDYWAGVKILLGRRPLIGPEMDRRNVLPDRDHLPDTLRLYVSPNPPMTKGAPVGYIFYKDFRQERKVLIYFAHFTPASP